MHVQLQNELIESEQAEQQQGLKRARCRSMDRAPKDKEEMLCINAAKEGNVARYLPPLHALCLLPVCTLFTPHLCLAFAPANEGNVARCYPVPSVPRLSQASSVSKQSGSQAGRVQMPSRWSAS